MDKVIRTTVLNRDKRICQTCGKRAVSPQVHHITPRRQGGTDELSNLITLCGRCHMIISPVPPFALYRAFGVRESEIPCEKRRIENAIRHFQANLDSVGQARGPEILNQRREAFSEKVSTSDRTYFFDVKYSRKGDKYLVITESRENNRDRILVFEESLDYFCSVLKKAIDSMKS